MVQGGGGGGGVEEDGNGVVVKSAITTTLLQLGLPLLLLGLLAWSLSPWRQSGGVDDDDHDSKMDRKSCKALASSSGYDVQYRSVAPVAPTAVDVAIATAPPPPGVGKSAPVVRLL
jgi:hypothetical protein